MEIKLENNGLLLPHIKDKVIEGKDNNYFQKILNNALNQSKKEIEKTETEDLEEKAEMEKLQKASKLLESFFIFYLFKQMDKTIQRTGFLDGGIAEEIFRDMLYDEMSKKIAEQKGIGIADLIINQLKAYKF